MEHIELSDMEYMATFIITNVMSLTPFLATFILCVLVVVKLAQRNGTVQVADRVYSGDETCLSRTSKRASTALAASPQDSPDPLDAAGNEDLDLHVIKLDERSSTVRGLDVLIEDSGDQVGGSWSPNNGGGDNSKGPAGGGCGKKRNPTKSGLRIKKSRFGSKLRLLRVNRSCKMVTMMIVFYILCLLPSNLLNFYNMLHACNALPVSWTLSNISNGGYQYVPIVGYFGMEHIELSDMEYMATFIITNVMSLTPFLATFILCVLVVVKLAQRNGTVQVADRVYSGDETCLSRTSKRASTALSASPQDSPDPLDAAGNEDLDLHVIKLDHMSSTVGGLDVLIEDSGDQVGGSCSPNNRGGDNSKGPAGGGCGKKRNPTKSGLRIKKSRFGSKLRLLRIDFRFCNDFDEIMEAARDRVGWRRLGVTHQPFLDIFNLQEFNNIQIIFR
eukprot:sb/3464701/